MGLREALNEHRLASSLATIAMIALAIGLAMFWRKDEGGTNIAPTGQCWFTIDDGKNWFADDARKLAPFDHEGKVAYRCYVYTCDGGKTKFVTHLERYLPGAKKALEERRQNRGFSAPMAGNFAGNVEVKAPGAPESEWVKLTTPRGAAIIEAKCPDGSKTNLEPVVP